MKIPLRIDGIYETFTHIVDAEGSVVILVEVEHADEIIAACNMLPELIEALELSSGWMKWWLDNNECDCEMDHICGKPERQRELNAINELLAKVRED